MYNHTFHTVQMDHKFLQLFKRPVKIKANQRARNAALYLQTRQNLNPSHRCTPKCKKPVRRTTKAECIIVFIWRAAAQVTCLPSLEMHSNSAEYRLRFPHFPFLVLITVRRCCFIENSKNEMAMLKKNKKGLSSKPEYCRVINWKVTFFF